MIRLEEKFNRYYESLLDEDNSNEMEDDDYTLDHNAAYSYEDSYQGMYNDEFKSLLNEIASKAIDTNPNNERYIDIFMEHVVDEKSFKEIAKERGMDSQFVRTCYIKGARIFSIYFKLHGYKYNDFVEESFSTEV